VRLGCTTALPLAIVVLIVALVLLL